jgi:hypothetical protein
VKIITHDGTVVLVLDSTEARAVRHALIRFGNEPMAKIDEIHRANPSGPIWQNWRTAQALDLAWREQEP